MKIEKDFCICMLFRAKSVAAVQVHMIARNSCRTQQLAKNRNLHHMLSPISKCVPLTVMAVCHQKKKKTHSNTTVTLVSRFTSNFSAIFHLYKTQMLFIAFNYSSVPKCLTSNFCAALILSISLSLVLDTWSSVAASKRKRKFSFSLNYF